MTWARLIIVAIAVAVVPLSAVAFQETPAGQTPAGQGATVAPAEPAVDLDVPGAIEPETGTEVRIPGLGTIGVLPKLDFGLELLYGATGKDGKVDPDEELAPSEDLTVKGRLKQTF